MERWGLTVNAWGEFSLKGKTELAFYERHSLCTGLPRYFGELAAAEGERVVLETRSKSGTF
jgi:hypothetical protein